MKIYADQPARAFGQVVTDLLLVAWVLLWVAVGRGVHQVVSALAAPGRTLEAAGTSLEEDFASAGERMADVPVVGDDLQAPFIHAQGAAAEITAAGVDLQDAVAAVAIVAALAVAVLPVVVGVAWWVHRRMAFIRQATAVDNLVRGGADLDLFALRALVRQPVTVLARLTDDPVGDWRRGTPETVRALARLELAEAGIVPR